MKRINKTTPRFFTDYVKKEKPRNWEEVSYTIREYIRIFILSGLGPNNECMDSEQNFQCAYSEVNIEPDGSSSHIDHYYKRDWFAEKSFDWFNLFVSTNNEAYGAKYKDNHSKLKKEDYDLLLKPDIDDPRLYFKYSFTGEIGILSNNDKSIEYKKAKRTIEVFNLNEKSLVEQRRTVMLQIKAFFEYLTIEEIKSNIGKFDTFIEAVYQDLKDLSNYK